MANIIEIRDFSAPELDVYARLTENQLLCREHPEQALFIAESPKVITRALDAGCQPVSILLEPAHIEGAAREILARCGDIPVYTASDELLQQLTGYALTRGFLAALRRPPAQSGETVCKNARRVAVLENIVDPTNVGALFRSAAALGMDAVFLSPSCCDPLHRRALRVSMGTVFQVPWARLGSDHSRWPEEGLELLHTRGFKTCALALDERAISVEDPRLRAEEKLALVLGTEGNGLQPETVAACDYTVMIPMAHGVNSLNVAAAGAVAFWALRSR